MRLEVTDTMLDNLMDLGDEVLFVPLTDLERLASAARDPIAALNQHVDRRERLRLLLEGLFEILNDGKDTAAGRVVLGMITEAWANATEGAREDILSKLRPYMLPEEREVD